MSIKSDLNPLRGEVVGEVIEPSDEGYEGNEVFYEEYNERRPRARVRVANVSDVSKVIGFARDNGVDLAVRGGGHSVLGHSTTEGGLVLDMSALKDIDIDAEGASAWAGGGVLAGEYTARAAEHGLVTGFGDTGSVGVTGLTLGGGMGFLHRKLGLTIDSLLGAEIVTADGEIHRIDETNDPDLFWAIRGGGGNFGAVTRLHYRLHPVDTVLGGMLILPATPQVIADLVALAIDASDDLSVIVGGMVAPPMPFLPEEVHGQLVVLAMIVHAGHPTAGEIEVDRFRKLATPLHDDLAVLPYTRMFPGEEGGPPQPVAMSVRSVFSDEFTVTDAEILVDALRSSTASMTAIQIRVMGGAVSRVPNEATAFAHRDRAMVINVAAAYENASRRPEYEVWVENLSERLRNGEPGSYLNFLGDDSGPAVRQVYPGSTWDRLVEVKSKFDGNNIFRSNHNIPPGG
jgi:FAD/FMN-containing dehydrogenase